MGRGGARRPSACSARDDYGGGRYILCCYVEQESAAGLAGSVGIGESEGATGFEEDLAVDEAA